MRLTHEQFRELAWKHGLAATHQRQIVYEAVVASHAALMVGDTGVPVGVRTPAWVSREMRAQSPSETLPLGGSAEDTDEVDGSICHPRMVSPGWLRPTTMGSSPVA